MPYPVMTTLRFEDSLDIIMNLYFSIALKLKPS